MSKKHSHSSSMPSAACLLSSSALGFLCALISLFPISALCAALCMLAKDPNPLAYPFAILSLFLSSMIGGLFSSRRTGGAPLPCGLLCGGMLMLFSVLFSLFFSSASKSFSAPLSLILRLGILLFCLLGALLGTHKRTHRRHRRQKR